MVEPKVVSIPQFGKRAENASALAIMVIENISTTVPIWHKANLTIKEASEYSGIGASSLRAMIKDEPNSFSFQVGSKWLINRKLFDEYIMRVCSGEG